MDQTIHTFRAREQPQPTPTNENLNPFLNKSATQKDLRDHPTRTPTRTNSSKEVSIPIQIRQNKRKLAEDLAATKFTDRCPNHSQEPFEFYSFTDDSLLCTKCLVTGKYVKHEVLNIKKANEKINSVLKEVINGIRGRAVNYHQWQKNLANKKIELEGLIPSLHIKVHEGIEKLKAALDNKEKDIINKINQAKIDKETQYEKLEDEIRVLMEEINMIGQVLQSNLSNLNELNLCSYYSQKHNFIIDFLKSEESFRSKNSNTVTSSLTLDDNFDLKKFQDSLKTFTNHINNLSSPSTPSQHPRDFLRLSMNSINKISTPVSGTPSASYLTPSNKEDLKTLQTEASLPLTTKDTEAPISTMRQREERSNTSKSSKNSYLEGYFDQLDRIRKKRTMESSGASPMNDALSRSAQAISDTERRLQSRRKATNIADPYQRLQDSRREGIVDREKSLGKGKEEVKAEPSSRIVVADLLMKKNPVLSPSRSFLSPTLKQRPEAIDVAGNINMSGSMNKSVSKSFLMENLMSYKSPDAKNRSMNLSSKLQNARRER